MQRLAIATAAAVICCGTSAFAASINYDDLTFGDGQQLPAGYGSTAEVSVTHRSVTSFTPFGAASTPNGGTVHLWNASYNDLFEVAWFSGSDAGSRGDIALLPASAHGRPIELLSLDLGAYPNAQLTTSLHIFNGDYSIEFLALDNILIGQDSGFNPQGAVGNEHSHFDLGFVSLNGFHIQFGPSAFNVGIDNIEFDVGAPTAVAEPMSLALFSLGLLGLGFRRRIA